MLLISGQYPLNFKRKSRIQEFLGHIFLYGINILKETL